MTPAKRSLFDMYAHVPHERILPAMHTVLLLTFLGVNVPTAIVPAALTVLHLAILGVVLVGLYKGGLFLSTAGKEGGKALGQTYCHFVKNPAILLQTSVAVRYVEERMRAASGSEKFEEADRLLALACPQLSADERDRFIHYTVNALGLGTQTFLAAIEPAALRADAPVPAPAPASGATLAGLEAAPTSTTAQVTTSVSLNAPLATATGG